MELLKYRPVNFKYCPGVIIWVCSEVGIAWEGSVQVCGWPISQARKKIRRKKKMLSPFILVFKDFFYFFVLESLELLFFQGKLI